MPSPKTLVALSLIEKPVVYPPANRSPEEPVDGELALLSVVMVSHGEAIKEFIKAFMFMRNTGNQYLVSEMRNKIDEEPPMISKRNIYQRNYTENRISASIKTILDFCQYVHAGSAIGPVERGQMAVIQAFLKGCHISVRLSGDEPDGNYVLKRFFTRFDTGRIQPFTEEAVKEALQTTSVCSYYRADFDEDTPFSERVCVMNIFTKTLFPDS